MAEQYQPSLPPGTQWLRTVTAPPPDPFAAAARQWPSIAKIPHTYSQVPGRTNLESWPPGEEGTSDYPRPKGIPMNQFGVEIFDRNIRPIDILADVVSHGTRFTDPRIKDYYQRFVASMTPQQQRRLYEQYGHYFFGEDERRPFEQWRETSGIPAWFRGYAFQQWPKEFTDQAYTPEQRDMFDEMMRYLSGG